MRSAPVESKVPAVTLGFWLIKILATTLGETGGNAVSMSLGFGYLLGSILFVIPLAIAIAAQMRATRFSAPLYWTTITLTTLAGTTLADFFDRSLGVGYAGGSIILSSLVAISLAVWSRRLGRIDVTSIDTPQAERYYWITVLFSQTLGTALGDWMANGSGLGYIGSAALIACGLLVLALLHFRSKASPVLLFWSAFVLTRPLGATVADALSKLPAQGGLGIGDPILTGLFAGAMAVALFLIPQRSASAGSGRQAAMSAGAVE